MAGVPQQYAQDLQFNYLAQVSTLSTATLDGTEILGLFKANANFLYYSTTVSAILAYDYATSSATVRSAYTALTNSTNATLTPAQVQPGRSGLVYVAMTGTAASPAAVTLPTVVALVAALGTNFVAGMSWTLRILNENADADAWTLTTAAGWTLTGTMIVGQNAWRDFVVTLTERHRRHSAGCGRRFNRLNGGSIRSQRISQMSFAQKNLIAEFSLATGNFPGRRE